LGIPLIDKPLSKEVWDPIINKLEDKIRKSPLTNIDLPILPAKNQLAFFVPQ